MQKPDARSAIAWWKPPPRLNARDRRPEPTSAHARRVAPAWRAVASNIPRNTGLSAVPSPCSYDAPRGSALRVSTAAT